MQSSSGESRVDSIDGSARNRQVPFHTALSACASEDKEERPLSWQSFTWVRLKRDGISIFFSLADAADDDAIDDADSLFLSNASKWPVGARLSSLVLIASHNLKVELVACILGAAKERMTMD
jgi:hypothetical protein